MRPILFCALLASLLAAQAPKIAARQANPPAAKPAAKADPRPAGPEYTLGPGDVIAIDVWHQPEISRTLPVRPDGRISLPLAGQMRAQGLNTLQLQAAITTRLKRYIDHPDVTVMLEKAESRRYNIFGMVQKPGSYSLDHPMTLLDAIAAADGLRDFAHGSKIYLIRKRRRDGVMIRYNFNYKAVSLGLAPQENIQLRPNDTIVVP